MSFDLFERIETDRLILRCVTLADAATTSAMMTAEISRWLAFWPMPFTLQKATERIEASRALALAGHCRPFGILSKATHDLLGWVMLHRDREDPRVGWFGYWLGERYQGLGYMREAAPPVLLAGFVGLEFEVIRAAAQPANAGSTAVLVRCGMRFVGERMIEAPARCRHELCHLYEMARPSRTGPL